MEAAKVPYEKILFVCINKRQPQEVCCWHRDSEAIAELLKARVKSLGLTRRVRGLP